MHDTINYLEKFDIILLSETRCSVLPNHFLSQYSIDYAPSSSNGKAGEGLLVAVKKCLTVHIHDFEFDDSCIWVKLTWPHVQTSLVVGCCYIPPVGSLQLQTNSARARFSQLETQLLQAGSVMFSWLETSMPG